MTLQEAIKATSIAFIDDWLLKKGDKQINRSGMEVEGQYIFRCDNCPLAQLLSERVGEPVSVNGFAARLDGDRLERAIWLEDHQSMVALAADDLSKDATAAELREAWRKKLNGPVNGE